MALNGFFSDLVQQITPPIPAFVPDALKKPLEVSRELITAPVKMIAEKDPLMVAIATGKAPKPGQVLTPPRPPVPSFAPSSVKNLADKAYNFISAPIRSTIAADPLLSWAETGRWSSHAARTRAGVHEMYKEDRIAQRLGVREKDVVTALEVAQVVVAVYFGGSYLMSGSGASATAATAATPGAATATAAGGLTAGEIGAGAASALSVATGGKSGDSLTDTVVRAAVASQANKNQPAQLETSAEISAGQDAGQPSGINWKRALGFVSAGVGALSLIGAISK